MSLLDQVLMFKWDKPLKERAERMRKLRVIKNIANLKRDNISDSIDRLQRKLDADKAFKASSAVSSTD